MKATLFVFLCSVGLAACGGAPSPVDQLAATQAAVRAAEEAGAEKHPEALLYLKLSRENLEKAKAMMEDEKNEPADRLLRKGESDADLARGIARKATAEDEAEEAKQILAKLKPVTH